MGRVRVGCDTSGEPSWRRGDDVRLASRSPVPTLLVALILLAVAAELDAFEPGRVSFAVHFENERTTLDTLAVFVLPDEVLRFEVDPPRSGDRRPESRLVAAAGELLDRDARRWQWRAPHEPGVYPVRIVCGEETMLLNVFVMVPAEQVQGEYLLSYRLGLYPSTALRGLDVYKRPRGFVVVTPEIAETKVSPHFVLRQFLCKQDSDYPKLLVLRERLLRKLELMLEELNRQGHPAETLFVMSGYRTPHYNRAIGNVKYSRHIYGDAADVFVDEDGNGYIDDLNGDGTSDDRDADVLHDLVLSLNPRPAYRPFIGGLSRYRAKPPVRGPFVHVDTRGVTARW